MRRPVRPRVLQFEPHLTLSCQTEPVLCDGRPKHVSADSFEALALTRRDENACMEIEAVLARVTRSERGRRVLLGLGSKSAHARTRPVAERHHALHGRRRDPRQHGRVLRPRVWCAARLVVVAQTPSIEQAPDARLDRREYVGDIRRSQRWRGMEPHARTIFREHAVDHERVDVDVQEQHPTIPSR